MALAVGCAHPEQPPARSGATVREDAAGHIFVEYPPVVRIRGVPRHAAVTLDGLFVGRGDWEGKVVRGDHEVEVVAEGYTAGRAP